MGADADRSPRAVRVATLGMASLFLLVIMANLLWAWPTPFSTGPPPLPSNVSPFPVFNRTAPVLHAVHLAADANLSIRLLTVSLQGLVNRGQIELFLDVGGVAGNTSRIRSFLASRYNVMFDDMPWSAAIGSYAPRTAGLVVYDPAKPESINIATMLAAQRNALVVGPDMAGWVQATYDLPILFDYASGDWASLDAIGAYERALQDLYPSSGTTLLSILPPDRWAIRDYLVATRTFVFYLPQGALASPFEIAATRRILHAAPRGIPVLGWFDSVTLTEENAFVQMVSAEGKFVVGAQDLPNLSVLTAFGRNETHPQVTAPPPSTPLENKTYVVLAVPDGDNLDFVAGRMWELWSEPVRGTMPFAWSLNPLLVDLAPPLLDAYYDTASPLDRFISAPSGAGYLYPDFTRRDDLASYVAFSKRYLDAADMDVVWLLNAFTASEILYTSESLSAYVDGLHPDGIVLDYADQPRTRDVWVQAGAQGVAPVVRSTHFWTTPENVLGKLGAAGAVGGGNPHFLWLTVYTFRYDLRDAQTLIDTLNARTGGNMEVVTPGEFFRFLRQDFVRSAQERLRDAESDPLAATLFGTALASARTRLIEAAALLVAGEPNRAADAASRGLDELRAIAAFEALLVTTGVVLVAGALAFLALRSERRGPDVRETFRPTVLLFITAVVAFLVFALREALLQNFWTYPTILIGIAFSGLHRPLRRALDRAYPDRASVAGALAALVLSSLAIQTTIAFPLALIGGLLALEAFQSRRPASSSEILTGLGFGTAIGFLGGFDLPTFTVLAIVLVASASTVRGGSLFDKPPASRGAIVPGFLLVLPLSGLAVAFYYSLSVRLEVQGDALLVIAGALLVLGPTLGILVRRMLPRWPTRRAEIGGLATAAVLGGIVLVTEGTLPTVLALLAMVAALSVAALAALDECPERGGEPRRALAMAIVFLPLLVLFFRMPPIVYSLTIVRLPESVEYVLYAPTAILAATCLTFAVLLGLRGLPRTRVGKHYLREGDGRPGGR